MQLTRDASATHFIRAWETGRIRVGEHWVAGNVIVASDRVIADWTASPAAGIALADLAPAIALAPQIILLGTGPDMLLPDLNLMSALAERAIGLEIMSTPAACRTYNVLVQEERRVVAALFNTR